MKFKLDKWLFALSLLLLFFYFTLIHVNRLIYLIPILFLLLFLLLKKYLFYSLRIIETKIKQINKNQINTVKLFLFFILLTGFVGRYDILNIKSFVKGSQEKFSSQIASEFSKNSKNYYTKNSNEIIRKNFLNSEDLVLLTKVQSDKIRLLNHKYEDIKNFSINSSKFKEAVPFYLLKNGDLIASTSWWFETGGLARLDKNFKTMWKIDKEVHHFASIVEDILYIPSFASVEWKDFQSGELFKKFKDYNCNPEAKKFLGKEMYDIYKKDEAFLPKNYEKKKIIRQDEIIAVNLDNGKILKEINILNLLADDEHFLNIIRSSKDARCWDLLHLNDIIKVERKIFIENYQNLEIDKGNISDELFLLSLRDINTLLIFDFESKKILWSVTGLTHNQHSPRLLKNGNILIFDNFSYEHNGYINGYSSIKEISIKSKKIVADYNGYPSENLSSKRRGRLQVVGNKIFTLVSDQKKLVEIECQSSIEVFLKNCKSKLLYKLNTDVETLYMSDIYKFTNGKFQLLKN